MGTSCLTMNGVLTWFVWNINFQYLVLVRFQCHMDVDILLVTNENFQLKIIIFHGKFDIFQYWYNVKIIMNSNIELQWLSILINIDTILCATRVITSFWHQTVRKKFTQYRNFSKYRICCCRYKKVIFSGVLRATELVFVADAKSRPPLHFS